MAQNEVRTKCVMIGGSAGSLQIMGHILAHLRPDLAFPIIIVLHRKADHSSNLAEVLGYRSALRVKEADDKEELIVGQVYVAPAGYHLLVEKNGSISLDGSEKVNYSRPSIDVTFDSGADAFGPSLSVILLSGANQDGREGFRTVKRSGGILIVQDPSEAQVPVMPQSVIDEGLYDDIFSTDQIISYINQLNG